MTQPPAIAGGRLLDVPGGTPNGDVRGGDLMSPWHAGGDDRTAGNGAPAAGNGSAAMTIPAPPEGHPVPDDLVMPPEPAAPPNGAGRLGEQPTDVEPFDPESFVEALFT